MADIFISYARKDRDAARRFAALLTEQGWSVWWDRKIRIGYTFSHVIERELAAARCVVVIWSLHSINSEWVSAEAAEGAERNALVPIRIDDVRPPLEFRRRQTATLDRELSDEVEVAACIEAIREVVGEHSDGVVEQTAPDLPPRRIRRLQTTRRRWLTVAVVMAAIGVGAYFGLRGKPHKEQATSTTSTAPAVLTTDTNARLAMMVGDGKRVNEQVLELRGFELSDADAQRPVCTINGTNGPCGVEAFVWGEAKADPTAHTCAKLDRATYSGGCVDGKLEGVSLLFADGRAKAGKEVYLAYFSRGRLVYPAVTTYLNADQLNFGVRERRRSYGCVYYGLWDQSKTRAECARMRKVYGDDIFSEANARALKDRTFNLQKYAENFRQYLLNPQ